MLAHTYSHRHERTLCHPPQPPRAWKRPRRQVWFPSRSRAGSGDASNSGSAALPQILSVVVWRHVIDVNLVAFLRNGKESGCVRGSISERGPCTGRPALLRGACGEEGSKIQTHKSLKLISPIAYKISVSIRDEGKGWVSDIRSYGGQTAGISFIRIMCWLELRFQPSILARTETPNV